MPRVKRSSVVVILAVATLLAGPAFGSRTGSADLLKVFAKQLPAVKRKTKVAVLLPASLPFAARVPKLYATGYGTKDGWGLVLAGARNCRGANACFLASFEGSGVGRLLGRPNLRLAGGQPAFFKPPTCGASCSPATLSFMYRGVLYTWQHKDPPRNAKAVLARLAAQAISAGRR